MVVTSCVFKVCLILASSSRRPVIFGFPELAPPEGWADWRAEVTPCRISVCFSASYPYREIQNRELNVQFFTSIENPLNFGTTLFYRIWQKNFYKFLDMQDLTKHKKRYQYQYQGSCEILQTSSCAITFLRIWAGGRLSAPCRLMGRLGAPCEALARGTASCRCD